MELKDLIKNLKEENVNLVIRGGAENEATGEGSWTFTGSGFSLSDLWDNDDILP